MTTECVICMDQRVSRYSPFATLRDVSELECEDGEKSQVETNIDISLYLNLIHFKAIFSLRWQTVRIFCCSLRKKYLKKAHVLIVSSWAELGGGRGGGSEDLVVTIKFTWSPHKVLLYSNDPPFRPPWKPFDPPPSPLPPWWILSGSLEEMRYFSRSWHRYIFFLISLTCFFFLNSRTWYCWIVVTFVVVSTAPAR